MKKLHKISLHSFYIFLRIIVNIEKFYKTLIGALMKKKHISFTSIIVFFLSFTIFSEEECHDVPELDGITSASKSSRIVSAEACETYIVLKWRVGDDNGEQKFQIGISKNKYDKTIKLFDIKTSETMTTKISGLKKNTKYYVNFFRRYEGKNKDLKFEIKTILFTLLV